MVSIRVSFFLVAEFARSTLIVLALVLFAAISKVFLVRVEGSKKRFATDMSLKIFDF
jgi:hypothetical protein